MKTSQYIIALLAGMAALSCVKETGKDLPAPEATDLITIKAAMPADATTKAGPYVGLSWGWQAGDKLAVTGAEETQIYSINDGFTAKYAEFTGRPVAGESFSIQYPDNAASADWSNQAQTGNGGYDHLKYVAILSDVDDYLSFSFSPAWAEAHGGSIKQTGVLKMVIDLPDTVSAVKGVSLSAEEAVFFKGNGDAKVNKLDLTVTDGVPDNKHAFTAWFTTSWNEATVAEGTVLTVSVKTADATISKEITLTKESVLQTGVVNVFNVNNSGWAQPSHYPSGNGSAEKPWVVMTPEQMKYMADDLAAGEIRYFQLGADVDMAGLDWTPLNNVEPYNKLISFDGCGHTISNLTVGECAYASFAGVLYGSVKDVNFVSAKISAGANEAGVVAAYVGKTENLTPCSIIGVTVKNSSVSGSKNNIGGFIGVTDFAGAQFENCAIEGGDVTPTAGVRYVGGFVANINKAAVFKNCTVKGVTVDASASNRVAGFAGQAGRFEGSEITGCVVEDATINAGQNSAGFVGVDYGPNINKCAVIGGTITGSNTQVAGFAAYPEGNDAIKAQITDCYSTMKVVGGEKANIGGFIGIAKGNIIVTNCYAAGEVTGSDAKTGIFAGSVDVVTASISSCIGWNATLPFAGVVKEGAEEVKDNYAGAEGTLTAQATGMGWSADIWDFSGDTPKLK